MEGLRGASVNKQTLNVNVSQKYFAWILLYLILPPFPPIMAIIAAEALLLSIS